MAQKVAYRVPMTKCVLWMNVAIGQLVRLGVAHARRTRRPKEMTRSAEVMGDVQRKIVVKSPAMICLKTTMISAVVLPNN